MNKWIARLDTFKERYELTSDRQAAHRLGISQQALQQIRAGKTNMSIGTKLKILDGLGFTSLRDAIAEVLPEDRGEELKQKMNKLTSKILDKEL